MKFILLTIVLTNLILFSSAALIKSKAKTFTRTHRYEEWKTIFNSSEIKVCVNINGDLVQGPKEPDFKEDYVDPWSVKSRVKVPEKNFLKGTGISGDTAYVFDFMENVIVPKLDLDNNNKDDPDKYTLGTAIRKNFQLLKSHTLKLFKETEETFKVTKEGMKTILNDWKWIPGADETIADEEIAKFDFDASGELNEKEFIVAAIMINHNKLTECINCFKPIIQKVLVPIYDFMDCDSDGLITAENMWENYKKFKRAANVYDMYDCKVNNNYYHTKAVNDFVLKFGRANPSTISKDEYVKEILLGFAERYLKYPETIESAVADRWANDGKTDKECESLRKYLQ